MGENSLARDLFPVEKAAPAMTIAPEDVRQSALGAAGPTGYGEGEGAQGLEKITTSTVGPLVRDVNTSELYAPMGMHH